MPKPTTRSRQELRTRFVRNAIPTEADFHDLINASLNLADDGLLKLPEQPLGLVRQKKEQPAVLRLYADAAAAEAAWQMQLIGENNPSFGLAGSNQSLALFIEGGTRNVGIGTSEPKAKLHVAGSLQVDETVRLGVDREISFEGNGKIRSRSDNHALLFRASENILEIREWGDIVLTAGCGGSTPLVPKLVVKETGSVGIGTTSPSAKLEVSNGSIKISSDDHGIDFFGGAKIYKKLNSGLKIKPHNDAEGIEFLKADGTTSVMRIVGDKLGIGTLNPAAKLHVAGSLHVDETIRLGVDREISFEGNGKIRSRSDNHALLFRASENILELREWGDIVLTAGCGGSTPLVPKLVVKETGSVGIGTTSPSAKLEVSNGSIKISSDDHGIDFFGGAKIYKKLNSGLKIKPHNDAEGIEFLKADGTTSVMRIAGDKLGIGTLNPAAKLHVAGSLHVDETIRLGVDREISFEGNGKIRARSDNHALLFRASENILELREWGDIVLTAGCGGSTPLVPKLVVKENGDVGIGTLTPTAKLEVSNGSIKISSDDHGIDFFGGAKIYKKLNSGLKIKSHNDAEGIEFLKADGTTSVMKIIGDRLGIGTSSPNANAKLHVAGSLYIDDNMTLRNGSQIAFSSGKSAKITCPNNYHSLFFHSEENKLELREYGDIIFSAGSKDGNETAKMVVTSDGNVGIGTTTPEQKLHVQGKIRLSDVPVWDGPSEYDLTWVGVQKNAGTSVWTDKYHCIARESSSRRYKKNIIPLEDDFMKLLSLEPHKYQMREGYGTPGFWSFGYLAEDLDQLGLKTLVTYNEAGQPEGINYKKICIYLNEILKGQQECLISLESQIRELSQAINPPPKKGKSADNE